MSATFIYPKTKQEKEVIKSQIRNEVPYVDVIADRLTPIRVGILV